MKNKPNFLIIGANKGGTTSLYMYLRQHPEIFMSPIKEPMFFNHYLKDGEDGTFRTQKVIKTFASYEKLFEGSEGFKAKGEASTSYLANPACAANIFDFDPKMKLIAVLRNPIKRAFSNYLMYVRWGNEERSFSRALADEMNGKTLPQGKKYIYLGHYLDSLKTFEKQFGRDQLKIFLNEDLIDEPLESYREICQYLNIDDLFVPNFKKKYNNNNSVEHRFPHNYLKKLDRKIPHAKYLPKAIKNEFYGKPLIPKKEKKLLHGIYKEEIEQLSTFIDRDLSHWLH